VERDEKKKEWRQSDFRKFQFGSKRKTTKKDNSTMKTE
jgi:hypothetical protein